MEAIRDRKLMESLKKKADLESCFDTPDLEFQALRYEKGEFLARAGQKMERILFLVQGSVKIYALRDDGSLRPVNQSESPCIIGDLEYTTGGISPFFAEADSTVLCLSLSLPRYGEILKNDVRFLHTLLDSYARKLVLLSALDTVPATLEEKVLVYLNSLAAGKISSIEEAVLRLRCSRRQLQRVLRHLCETGQLEKTGRGCYQLAGRTENDLNRLT